MTDSSPGAEPFRFLSTPEFNALSQSAKMAYLTRASAALNRRSEETARLVTELNRQIDDK